MKIKVSNSVIFELFNLLQEKEEEEEEENDGEIVSLANSRI